MYQARGPHQLATGPEDEARAAAEPPWESEECYRQLVENSDDLIALIDLDGRVVLLNRGGEAILGRPREEVIGRSFLELVAPEFREAAREHIEKALAGDASRREVRGEVLGPGDARIALTLWASPFVNEGPPRGVQIVMWEFPAWPIADWAAAAQTRFRSLFEQLPAITYVAPAEHIARTSYVGGKIELLGYTPEEWVADPESFPKHLHPDDRERVLAEISSAVEAGVPYVDEYRMLARDGRVVWMRDHGVVLEDEEGKRFLVGIILDVTDRRRLEEAQVDRERLAREIVAAFETRGLPSGTWLVDIEQTRRALQDADGLLRRLADAIVRSGPSGPRA